jgi:hypothetical protein
MNYSHTAPVDLSASSLWPDDPVIGEEDMAAWAQAFWHEGIPLDIQDASLPLGQSGTTFAEPSDFKNNSVSIFALGTGRTDVRIGYQLGTRRDGGRGDVEPSRPSPGHRNGHARSSHHAGGQRQQPGRIHWAPT